jgi:hypothetical protein
MEVKTLQSRCRVGVARGDITPEVGTYHRMWGAASHDCSEGVHRPLTATALAFGSLDGNDDERQVVLAVDHCLLGFDEVENILNLVHEQSGVDRTRIVTTFSHTHAAGMLLRDRVDLPGGDLIPSYLDGLAETLGALTVKAIQSMVPANIVYGDGVCNLAGHRDLRDNELGENVCGFNPEGLADTNVVVARISDDQGDLMATVVNYACHPTTLAWDNRLISPDFPGAMRELVEGAFPAPCIFLQGASGDLGPVEGFVGDTEVADRNGRQLGYAALSALTALRPANTSFAYAGPVVSGATIGVWEDKPIDDSRRADLRDWSSNVDTVSLPYREDLPKRAEVQAAKHELERKEQSARASGDDSEAARLRALAERQTRMLGRLSGLPEGTHYPYQASVWKIGDAVWVCVQGEPYNVLQRDLRAAFPDTPIMVATISNGWGPSYLPNESLYGQEVYQESIASLAPGSLETLIDTLIARIKQIL